MRFKVPFGIVAMVALALPISSSAATISWNAPDDIPNSNTVIASAGVTGLAGVDFGSSGGPTVVNNGTVNVTFTHMLRNTGPIALGNGISVASSGWTSDDTNSLNSIVLGTFGPVLDTNIGIAGPTSATISLSGLTIGTAYRVQVFASSVTANSFDTMSVSGSPTFGTHASGAGRYALGTFTADATSQALSVSAGTGDTAVVNALTVGAVVPEPTSAVFGGLTVAGLIARRRRI